MPEAPRHSIHNRRHQPWQENPSEEWAFALEHMDRGDWENAIHHCERAIELWPTYFDAWLLMAGALEDGGDYDRALDAVRRASEIAISELSQAWNNLASLHLIRHEWEAAITVDRILDLLDPARHAIICYRMAVSHTQLGDLDSGLNFIREAIQYRPDLLERALKESWLAPLHPQLQPPGA